VAKDKGLEPGQISFRSDPHGRQAEAYRHIRTNLQFIEVDTPPRVIAICSSVPKEGKTLSVRNLAGQSRRGRTQSLPGRRGPAPVHDGQISRTGREVGFTSVLAGNVSLQEARQNAGQNLAVLPAGAVPPPNPGELLASARAGISSIRSRPSLSMSSSMPRHCCPLPMERKSPQ